MNPSPVDPSDADAPVLGPAVSPRVSPRASDLGALGEPVAPFNPRSAEPPVPAEPVTGNPEPTPAEPAAAPDLPEERPWLYGVEDAAELPAAAPAEPELDIDLSAGWEGTGEPLEFAETLPESGVGHDDELWGSLTELDALGSLLQGSDAADRWSEFQSLDEPAAAGEEPTAAAPAGDVADIADVADLVAAYSAGFQTGELSTGIAPEAEIPSEDAAAAQDTPSGAPDAPAAELAGGEAVEALPPAMEAIPAVVEERPVVVDAAETPVAVESPEPAEASTPEAAEPTLAALPLAGMAEVADRLERIARSLRSGSPAELLGTPGTVDPLQLLIAGYAIGYSEAARAGGREARPGAE